MTSVSTKSDSSQPAAETAVYLFDNWFDPIESGLRDRVREFIHAMIEGELDVALSPQRRTRNLPARLSPKWLRLPDRAFTQSNVDTMARASRPRDLLSGAPRQAPQHGRRG